MSYNSYGEPSNSSSRWPPNQPYSSAASTPQRKQPQYSAQQGYQSQYNPNYPPADKSQTGAQTQLAPQQYQQGGYSSKQQEGYGAQAQKYPASCSGQIGGRSGGQPGSISAENPNLLTQLQTQLGVKVLGAGDPSQHNQYGAPAPAQTYPSSAQLATNSAETLGLLSLLQHQLRGQPLGTDTVGVARYTGAIAKRGKEKKGNKDRGGNGRGRSKSGDESGSESGSGENWMLADSAWTCYEGQDHDDLDRDRSKERREKQFFYVVERDGEEVKAVREFWGGVWGSMRV